jgi:hypothetical protein
MEPLAATCLLHLGSSGPRLRCPRTCQRRGPLEDRSRRPELQRSRAPAMFLPISVVLYGNYAICVRRSPAAGACARSRFCHRSSVPLRPRRKLLARARSRVAIARRGIGPSLRSRLARSFSKIEPRAESRDREVERSAVAPRRRGQVRARVSAATTSRNVRALCRFDPGSSSANRGRRGLSRPA